MRHLVACDPEQEKYSEPMMWVGEYIAVSSLLCIIAMLLDNSITLKGTRLWFPSIYFSLNATSITAIAVAMKLTVDLTSDMPTYMDQAAKVGSLAFMYTMMANLMPSLADMDNKSLRANIIGLSILVITMVVNIIIDTHTGVIKGKHSYIVAGRSINFDYNFVRLSYTYSAMILFLLVIMIASSLTIPTSKKILEVRYQARKKTLLTNQHLQDAQMSQVEKLNKNVRIHWVMAETGSPQFVMASSPLSTASGVICVIVCVLNLHMALRILLSRHNKYIGHYYSDYKSSILWILIVQMLGTLTGTIVHLSRFCALMRFNLVTTSNMIHLVGFQVEKYWTQKLCEWKESPIPFQFQSALISLQLGIRSRALLYTLKNIIISLCIYLQMAIVILCKAISLIPIIPLIFMSYPCRLMKVRLFTPPVVSRTDDDMNTNLRNYALHIHDGMEFADGTLERISNSINIVIKLAERQVNMDLFKLLERSTGFKGVEIFVNDNVQPLPFVQLPNNWSLPIVTLTCIAISLPNVHKDTIKRLIRSVSGGLSYTHLTEECLNRENEYVNIQRATIILWNEVELKCKWLNKAIGKCAFRGKTTTQILKWFSDRAEEILIKNQSMTENMVENTPKELIAANSMYRIAITIMPRGENNTMMIGEEELFALLNDMIADIFSACFTNLPRVIMVKCNESVIKKKEESVMAATELLAQTANIIERLEQRELPSMDPEKMAYIDEWRRYLKDSIP